MLRLAALGALALLLAGCVYYPYGYPPPRYHYYSPPADGYPPGYGPPVSAYPYAPPRSGSSYPQSLGPTGDTPGAVGGN